MTELFVRAKARDDLAEAADRYASSRADDRFITAWDVAQRRIRRHPSSGVPVGVVLVGLRRHSLKGFPYGVFYVYDDDRVEVLRVLHEHRDATNLLKGDLDLTAE